MKIFKFCLLPILLFVIAVFVVGYMSPEHWDVEVSTQISAKPEVIHPWLDDLKRWEEWTAWSDDGAKFEFTYEGAASGVGAVAHSKGPGSNVRWEITASDPQKGVWFDELLEGNTHAKGAIRLVAQEGGTTQVIWSDRGSLGTSPLLRLGNLVLQKALTSGFQRNLDKLKSLVEASR